MVGGEEDFDLGAPPPLLLVDIRGAKRALAKGFCDHGRYSTRLSLNVLIVQALRFGEQSSSSKPSAAMATNTKMGCLRGRTTQRGLQRLGLELGPEQRKAAHHTLFYLQLDNGIEGVKSYSSGSEVGDTKPNGMKDAATMISRAVSRRDMATQMSFNGSIHSSPKGRLSFSPTPGEKSRSSLLAGDENRK
ncbi:hypothetical protein NE237_023505 [Protea cynaroides]|uniref:Uncharacterized protein n=1 Tax=Protea cynaroides TaxID=273540 RepID=A0A9Q0HE52_9MAGN|nr:hypothetical protein NE237_023505 [Protea cynaroides]